MNTRSTRSAGRVATTAGRVVRIFLVRVAPWRPTSRIRRWTWSRPASTPSRCRARQTLRTPYTPKFARWTSSMTSLIDTGVVQAPRRGRAGLGRVVTRRGDRQGPADRLDPAYEVRYSSIRSSRFSRSSSFIRARSSLVSPARRRPSISAWCTQARSDSVPMPKLAGDSGDSTLALAGLLDPFEDQADGAFLQFRRVATLANASGARSASSTTRSRRALASSPHSSAALTPTGPRGRRGRGDASDFARCEHASCPRRSACRPPARIRGPGRSSSRRCHRAPPAPHAPERGHSGRGRLR